jgi:membrane-associated protease RseP (regulator of RpoE activity)
MRKRSLIGFGIALGVLAACLMLLAAGGVMGGIVGYVSARHGARQATPRLLQQPAQPPQSWPQVPNRQRQWSLPFGQAPGTLWGLVTGVRITEVVADSPAEEAGLKVGDVIIAIDGIALNPEHELSEAVQGREPGDEILLTIIRRGNDTEVLEVKVTLGRDTDEEGQVIAYLGIRYHYLRAAAHGTADWDPGSLRLSRQAAMVNPSLARQNHETGLPRASGAAPVAVRNGSAFQGLSAS